MPDRPSRRFFFDTVTLANFALGGRFGLLADRYGTCHFPAARFAVDEGRRRLAHRRSRLDIWSWCNSPLSRLQVHIFARYGGTLSTCAGSRASRRPSGSSAAWGRGDRRPYGPKWTSGPIAIRSFRSARAGWECEKRQRRMTRSGRYDLTPTAHRGHPGRPRPAAALSGAMRAPASISPSNRSDRSASASVTERGKRPVLGKSVGKPVQTGRRG